MPNSKLPIQRANSTWEPNASNALTTRIRNTVPARRCANRCSASSTNVFSWDQQSRNENPARKRGACSEPVSATRASAGLRPCFRPRSKQSRSKEPLTFGWAAALPLHGTHIGRDHTRIAQNLGGRAFGQGAAIVEHMNAVGQIGHHLQIVLDPDHRYAELMLDAQDEPRQILTLVPIEPGRWLVEHQQGGLQRERASEPDQLLNDGKKAWHPRGGEARA